MNQVTNIRKTVMRRVYYSYALSIAESSFFWQGVVLGGSVAAFGRLTHVAAIWQNILAVPVGQMPDYLLKTISHALSGGEVLTVLVTALILGLTLRFMKRLSALWSGSLQTV